MNWDQIEGNWKVFKGKIKEKWGEFTNDELDQIGGRKDQLIGKLQQKYGYTREQAEQQVEQASEPGSTQGYRLLLIDEQAGVGQRGPSGLARLAIHS